MFTAQAAAGLLGTECMAKADAITDFEYGRMVLSGNPNVTTVCNATPKGHTACTMFLHGKGHNLLPAKQETRHLEWQLPASSHEPHPKPNGVWLVRATKNTVVLPRSRQ